MKQPEAFEPLVQCWEAAFLRYNATSDSEEPVVGEIYPSRFEHASRSPGTANGARCERCEGLEKANGGAVSQVSRMPGTSGICSDAWRRQFSGSD